MTESPKSFGERLKWARKDLKLKVVETIIPALQDKGTFVSRSRWYEWERLGTESDPRLRRKKVKSGERGRVATYSPPYPNDLENIQSAFGIRAGWLITGNGQPYVTASRNRRKSDADPLQAKLERIYQRLTKEQKKGLSIFLDAFDTT